MGKGKRASYKQRKKDKIQYLIDAEKKEDDEKRVKHAKRKDRSMDIDETDLPRHTRKRVKMTKESNSKSMSLDNSVLNVISAPSEPSKSVVVSIGFEEAEQNKEIIQESRMKTAKRKRSLSIKQGKFCGENDEMKIE